MQSLDSWHPECFSCHQHQHVFLAWKNKCAQITDQSKQRKTVETALQPTNNTNYQVQELQATDKYLVLLHKIHCNDSSHGSHSPMPHPSELSSFDKYRTTLESSSSDSLSKITTVLLICCSSSMPSGNEAVLLPRIQLWEKEVLQV